MSEDSYSVYPTYSLLHTFTYYNIIQGPYSDICLSSLPAATLPRLWAVG